MKITNLILGLSFITLAIVLACGHSNNSSSNYSPSPTASPTFVEFTPTITATPTITSTPTETPIPRPTPTHKQHGDD